MSRLWWIPVVSLTLSCAAGSRPPSRAVPIKSACTAGTRAPSSVGLDVRAGRRHSDARTIFVTNPGDRPRTVRVQQVSRVEGPCSGEWARQTPLDFVDAATSEAPRAMTIPPNASLELRIGDQRVASTWACTKLGLSIRMAVDDEVVCADAGAWIAESGTDEQE
jgi:hypothetical protein